MIPYDGHCGKGPIPPKFESCKRMMIKFVSDSANKFKGFNATYTIKVTKGISFNKRVKDCHFLDSLFKFQSSHWTSDPLMLID